MNKLIEYSENFETINNQMPLRSNCNSMTVVNTGTATAAINAIPILPNQQYVIQGNENEINTTTYLLSFTTAGTQQVIVIRKIYK